MLYNKNIVHEIIISNFEQQIEDKVSDYVIDLDAFMLEQIFDQIIDYACVDYIESIEVEEYHVQNRDEIDTITGILRVIVLLEGYVHWDGEDEFVEDQSAIINFSFTFANDNNEYVGFNKNKDYFSDIPDINLFNTINTFWPGVAYNLNYAVKKENSYE